MPRHKAESGKQKSLNDVPIYIKGGGEAGYDVKSAKWRGADGRITTKAKALQAALEPQEWAGGFIKKGRLDQNPLATIADELAKRVSGMNFADINTQWNSNDWFNNSSKAFPMPSYILAAMKLSEWYIERQGDISQIFEIPIQIGLQDIVVESEDAGLQTALQDFYSPERGINLRDVLGQAWYITQIYGQCFPVEIFDKEHDPGVVFLNSKNVYVGQPVTISQFDYALNPPEEQAWTEELITDTVPKIMYVALSRDMNEWTKMGRVPLNPRFCYSIRAWGRPWQRYVMPPMLKAFRHIGTRDVLEEYQRSLLESYKNQLWLWLIGDKDHPPTPKMLSAIRSLMNTNERTSFLVLGNFPTEVKLVHAEPLDATLAQEMWQNLTWAIYRDLGMNPRLNAGEQIGHAVGRDFDFDISLYVERVAYQQKQLYGLERNIRRNWAEWDGTDAEKAMKAKVKFKDIGIQTAQAIRDKIVPMLQTGMWSYETAIEQSGQSFAVELARKKNQQKDAMLFSPQPTYSQETVNPDSPEKKVSTAPQGRPKSGTKNADQGAKKREEDDVEGSIWESLTL